MPSPLVFFQISSPDVARTGAFLSELFDWRFGEGEAPTIDPQGPGDFDPKGAFRTLPEGSAPAATLWFRVSDLEATVAKAESLGARVLVPIAQNPGGGAHVAMVRAPDGFVVGIVQA